MLKGESREAGAVRASVDTTSYHIPVAALTTWEEAKAKNPDLEMEEWEKNEEIKRKSLLFSSTESTVAYVERSDGPTRVSRGRP